jgi:glycosyltransferase involved in cell wall biosynthesis
VRQDSAPFHGRAEAGGAKAAGPAVRDAGAEVLEAVAVRLAVRAEELAAGAADDAVPGVQLEAAHRDGARLGRALRLGGDDRLDAALGVGGGTRIKIVEAAAHGRPVVSTRVGAEGLGLRDGSEILLRDAPEAFAEACAELLADRPLCRSIGGAARGATTAAASSRGSRRAWRRA